MIYAKRTQISGSKIMALAAKASALNAERRKQSVELIIDLSIGQPHRPVSVDIRDALVADLSQDDLLSQFGYSNVAGREETLHAVVQLYRQYYPQAAFNAHEVMCTHGANQGLWNAFSIFLNPGDTVLTFKPFFGKYAQQVESLGGTLVAMSSQPDFKPSAEQLKLSLEQHPTVKAIVLNFPNNPSGVCLNASDWQSLVAVLEAHPQVVVILDEVYRDLTFSGQYVSLLDVAPHFKERCIVINSGSKGLLGAPDLRVGMVGAPRVWIEMMCKQQSLVSSGVSLLSQKALVAAINLKLSRQNAVGGGGEVDADVDADVQEFAANVALATRCFEAMGLQVVPQIEAGFFVLVKASKWLNQDIPDAVTVGNTRGKMEQKRLATDQDVVSFLLETSGVMVVPGSVFGLDPECGFFRISCATAVENLQNALEKISVSGQTLMKGQQQDSILD